jgi:hypothetical protein
MKGKFFSILLVLAFVIQLDISIYGNTNVNWISAYKSFIVENEGNNTICLFDIDGNYVP